MVPPCNKPLSEPLEANIFCCYMMLLGCNELTHWRINKMGGTDDTQIAKFMGPTWDPPGDDRTYVGPMLAPWSLLSGYIFKCILSKKFHFDDIQSCIMYLSSLLEMLGSHSFAQRLPEQVLTFSFLAATKQLYEWYFLSVCPSVRLSHLFDYVPIIVSSWNFQELSHWTRVRSMQKFKVRGQRSRSQRSRPKFSFPDCNSSLNSHMMMRWYI